MMMNGTLMSRVPRSLMRRRPPPISSTAIAGARTSGIGIPSLVNRPTHGSAYANFSRPSQKKTAPAISRSVIVALGPDVMRAAITETGHYLPPDVDHQCVLRKALATTDT